MLNKSYICSLLVVVLCSCSGTKYVSDGEFLLDKVDMKVEGQGDGLNIGELESRIRQRGNSRWFSAVKIPLATYSLSGRDTTKWINRALRSMGEPPVIYDSAATERTLRELRSELANEGYLKSAVEAKVKVKHKKVDVSYVVTPGEP